MPYATTSDIRDAYGQQQLDILLTGLGDDTLDPDVYLNKATSLMNSYLGARYTVSDIEALAAVPEMLVDMCVDIAVYKLASGDPAKMTESMEANYDAHIQHLKSISRGQAVIDELEQEPASSVGGAVTINGPDRVMGREKMTDF